MLRLKVSNRIRTSTPRDKALRAGREALTKDAATWASAWKLKPAVLVVGTARSRREGANGVADYGFFEEFGKKVGLNGQALKTGGGPGAMQAPLDGAKQIAPHLERQGANITLRYEQSVNPAVSPGLARQYNHFLFRMAGLFWNSPVFAGSPGGFGTLAEMFGFSTYKEHGQLADPMVFGAGDAFFDRLTTAFAPMLGDSTLREYREGSTHSPAELASVVKGATLQSPPPSPEVQGRMLAELSTGFAELDQKPHAVSFIGGEGARSHAAAKTVELFAHTFADNKLPLRVAGSKVIDAAVEKGARRSAEIPDLTGFAAPDAGTHDLLDLKYTKVNDFLVRRELMNANIKAIVAVPDGVEALAQIFTAACDMQTGQLEKKPILIVDTDGAFRAALNVVAELMLSDTRHYISPEDLKLFHIVKSPAEAHAWLREQLHTIL